MIIFETVRFKNLLSYGNEFTEIFLDRSASTLIAAKNGHGKSGFIDAIFYALYGRPYRKINKPQLINSITGKCLLVEIEFTIGSKKYMVRRGAKPSVFEIFCDGNLLPQNADAKEYQDHLEKSILKINYKSFSQIVVLGTAGFIPFMQLPAHERRNVVEDLLDIQIFSKMFNILKDKITQNKTETTQNSYDIRLLEERIKMFKNNLANIKQNNKDIIQSKLDKVQNLIDEVKDLKQQESVLNELIIDLLQQNSDFEELTKRKQKYFQARLEINNKISSNSDQVDFFETSEVCPTCAQDIEHTHKITLVGKKKVRLEELSTMIAELDGIINKIDVKITEGIKLNEEISEKRKEIDSISVKINAINRSIRSYRNEIEELNEKTKTSTTDVSALVSLQDYLTNLKSDREKLINQKQVYDTTALMLKDTGIKTKIVKQYIPVINKLINKYLAAMEFYIDFELNDRFEEVIKSRFRDEFSYNSFSEGEKARLDLALLFAWRSLAKIRNSASTNLLILDEVFDGSLDIDGTDELLNILIGDKEGMFENVFVISHKNEGLYDKFHSYIEIEKVKNFSRIKNYGKTKE
jgi:DNA repair exonuclease SbcCD ATPase subunit